MTSLVEKWAPILDAEGSAPIAEDYRRKVTAILGKPRKSKLGKPRCPV